MVLSNKKLKQKVRSLVAESLTATESKKACKVASDEDANHQLQNLKELLRSKSQKPRTKRRKKLPLSEDSKPVEGSEETQKENGDNVVSISLNKKEKNKKRKREGDGADESVEKQQQKKANKKKKGKKKDKKKKEKEKEKDEKEGKKNEKGIEGVDGNSNENREDPVKIDESEENAKKVYVGGIPYYSTEDDIRSFFEGCGTVTEVDCMRFPESGKFRGIAMLTFKTEAAAKRALALDGADMGGLYLKVQPYKANRLQKSDFAPEIVDGYNRVYVGNLSWDITEDELRKFFSDCNISIIRFGTDKTTGDFKGYAHVDFSDDVSLAIALKLDQEVVCGRPARIRCAVPRKAGKTELTELSSTSTGKKAGEPDLSLTSSGKKAGGNDLRPTSTGEKARGNDMSSASTGNKTEIGTSGKKSKAKRRTCYVCGTPGHLSSSCPSKKTVEVNESGGNS